MSSNTESGPTTITNNSEPVSDDVVWLTARQAAEYTSCGVGLIRRACRHEELQHIRLGNRASGPILTRTDWVDAWLERGMVESSSNVQ